MAKKTIDTARMIQVQWMQRPNLGGVFRLSANCSEKCRALDELVACLESTDTVGLVATAEGQLIGFAIYQLQRPFSEVILQHLAVLPTWRRQGVGTLLLEAVRAKLAQGYDRVTALVSETNLAAQLFLRDRGFQAVDVRIDPDTEQTTYVMECQLPAHSTGQPS
jgi:ribosomal protein S18 acetylase RimI-like enzyme